MCRYFNSFNRTIKTVIFVSSSIAENMREHRFSLTVFSHIRTNSTILSLYGRIRVSKKPYSCIFYAVFPPRNCSYSFCPQFYLFGSFMWTFFGRQFSATEIFLLLQFFLVCFSIYVSYISFFKL